MAETPRQTVPQLYVAHGDQEYALTNGAQADLLRDVLVRGASLRTRVRGLSMSPFIHDDDVVTIAPLGARGPRVGDVVAFLCGDFGRLTIHRVVAREGDGWAMRGDNCREVDGVVRPENIMGRVVRVERDAGGIPLALGLGGRLIALLNRGNGLARLRRVWNLPRSMAASALHGLQGLDLYRTVAESHRLSIEIAPASRDELKVVARHLGTMNSLDPDVANLVARRGAKVIGCVQLVFRPERYVPWDGHWLFSLAVRARYRRLGVGGALTRHCMNEAAARGAEEILLVVNEDNVRAIRLYDKLGFGQVILPALEPLLAAEKEQWGQRRIVMRCGLTSKGRIG